MKKLFFLLALAVLPLLARAQTTVTFSQEYYSYSQCGPVRDPSTHAVTAAPWQVFFSQYGSDGSTRVSPVAPQLNVDLFAKAATTVTFTYQGQSVTVSYGEIITGIAAIIAQERAAQIAALAAPSGP